MDKVVCELSIGCTNSLCPHHDPHDIDTKWCGEHDCGMYLQQTLCKCNPVLGEWDR